MTRAVWIRAGVGRSGSPVASGTQAARAAVPERRRGAALRRFACGAGVLAALLACRVAGAAVPTVVIYDNLAAPSDLTFFGGQNGQEPRDDLHGVTSGPLYRITFDYDDPSTATDSIAATVSVYGNPGGNDIGTPLLWGPYTVTGLPRGRNRATVVTNTHPIIGPDLWVGVRFSSTSAGLVLHDPPATGFSHDYFNENGGLFNFLGSPVANFSIRVEAVQCPAPAIVYVNAAATGASDGSSWADAFTNLDDGLALAACGTSEVWVAAGTYRPRAATVVDFEDGPALALNDFFYIDPVESRGYRMNSSGSGLEWDADGAYNGTRSYFMDNIVGTLTRVDGGTFTPFSFRAGEDIDFVARTITVTGFFANGAQADTTYDIDGIGDGPGGVDDYQTFVLPASFTDLVSLRFEDPAGQMALDDIVIDGPPAGYATFALPAGVGVYGGFAGTETARAERDWTAHVTVLSGDIGTIGNAADNARHVVTAGPGAHLDGFTVTGGNAGALAAQAGGGILSTGGGSQTYEHLVVTGNTAGTGGGMYAAGGALALNDVTFSGNTAASSGGGLYSTGGAPALRDVVFTNNAAVAGTGGAVYNDAGAMTIAGAVFYANTAAVAGGALYDDGGGTTITSASFNGNAAGGGGAAVAVAGAGGTTGIWNSILWGDTGGPAEIGVDGPAPAIHHSIVQGSGGSGAGWDPAFGQDLGGNLDVDPQYVDASNGNLRPSTTSPARDAGDVGAPNLPTHDLDGAARIIGSTVDMGAYELPPVSVSVGDSVALFAGLHLSPNPLHGAGTVAFVARRGERTRVELFDVNGRLVRTLFDERATQTGIRRLVFRPQLPGGVYFLRLTSPGEHRAKRVVVLR